MKMIQTHQEHFEEKKFEKFLKRQKQENKFERNRLKKINEKCFEASEKIFEEIKREVSDASEFFHSFSSTCF